EFCPEIISPKNEDYERDRSTVTSENIAKMAQGPESNDSSDETASALLSLALQHTFCRQFDKALYYLNLWPETSKNPETTRKEVKAAFAESILEEYPDFAARLLSLSGTKPASAPPSRSPRLGATTNRETFLAANLSPAEQKEIIDQVEKTSFDVPDSWET